jgi:hypothetical protein
MTSMATKPNKCNRCDKKTDELYLTPIGTSNWRCRECQIELVEAIGYETCLDNQENLMSYPTIPNGYVSPNYVPKKKKGLRYWLSSL